MRAVGVLVPARDEEARVAACVEAVLTALDQLPGSTVAAVCVLVDRSVDDTAATARRAAGRRAGVDVVTNEEPATIGEVRNRAAHAVLERLGAVPPHEVLLLSTDADSRVPPDWAARHLDLARSGADAVSGGVLPDGPIPEGLLVPDGVYAANLGVRARPFLEVGGFPPVHSSEDLILLRRLRSAGYRVMTSAGIYVRTSVRTRGRAVGGLADRLRAVVD